MHDVGEAGDHFVRQAPQTNWVDEKRIEEKEDPYHGMDYIDH
jgi:hypothetical protein